MKTCSKCDIPKAVTEFPKNTGGVLRADCKVCRSIGRRASYLKNREKTLAQSKSYVEANKDRRQAYSKEYYANHKEKHARYMRQWAKDNPGKAAASVRKYQATKRNATPGWLTASQVKEMEQFYIEAKELSWLSESPLEVDHIMPLQGKNSCGLHVPWNLQLLPRSMNIAKGNRG